MSASNIGAAAGYAANMTIAPLTAAAGFVAGLGKENADEAAKLRKAQQKLEEQRRKELSDQASAREAARLKAEGTGATIGKRPAGTYSAFSSALGFGSGNTQQGLGTGNLFGN